MINKYFYKYQWYKKNVNRQKKVFFRKITLLVYFIFLYTIDRAFKLVCLFTFSISAILSEMFNLITFFERLHLVCPTFSSHLSLSLFFSLCLSLFLSSSLPTLCPSRVHLSLSLQQVTLHPRIVIILLELADRL